MTMGDPFFSDFFDTLEDNELGRRAQFEAFRPSFLDNPFQRSMFSNLLTPTFNRYLGVLGSNFRSGTAPATSFADFLEQQDFGRQARRFGPSLSGMSSSRLTSPAQFFFGR